MRENVKCETCNTPLYRNNSQIKASKSKLFFCNRECKSKWHSLSFENKRVSMSCKGCGTLMKDAKSRINEYCSRTCLGKVKTKKGTEDVSCDNCNVIFTKLKSQVKNKNFCSKSCSNSWNSKLSKRVTMVCKICNSSFKVSNNRKKTAKTCSRKCSNILRANEAKSNPKIKQQLIKNGVKSTMFGKKQNTLPERLTKKYLIEKGINFEFQKSVDDKYIVDFYIPSINLILEVYGDYWHCNPNVYDYIKNKPSEFQLNQVIKDEKRKKYLINRGYNFEYIWEQEIHTDLNFHIQKIINQYP